jgi:hypothetical protein
MIRALRTVAFVAAFALAGCAGMCPARVVTEPRVHETERVVVKRVDNDLTAHPPATDSTSLAQCPDVAKRRNVALTACYSQLDTIREQHGED